MRRKAQVLFICEEIKHYTVPFFRRLQSVLEEHGIVMRIVYGESRRSEEAKRDSLELQVSDPGLARKVGSFRILGGKILYQFAFIRALRSDLVVVDQANRHLINYFLMIAAKFGLLKFAFWGHGRNRQSARIGFSELLKGTTLCLADHWFAYTEGTREYLKDKGVDAEKITVIQNSVDTKSFEHELDSISEMEIAELRKRFNIEADDPVGIFCGSLYAEKEISLLIEAARAIHSALPRFHLLMVGAGPDEEKFRIETRSNDWIHWLGPLFEKEKAMAFRLSHGFLHPGAIGLAVLDSFTSGVPLLTTLNPKHGPEFEYLQNGLNAAVLPLESRGYIENCVALFQNPEKLRMLGRNAKAESGRYGVEPMVERFCSGILTTLDIPADRFH